MLRGFDVSAYQGTSVPKADFVFIKATEGKSYTSSKFAKQWADAKKKGMVRGAYHFARPEESSGSSQADRLLSVAKPGAGDVLVLDLEASKLHQAATNKFAKDFANRLKAKAPNCVRIIYMGSGYATNGTGKDLSDYYDYWWYPQYPSTKKTSTWKTSFSPWLPKGLTCGWSKPHIWQWTDNFGGLDASISTLSKSDLTKAVESPAAPPAPVKAKPVNTAPSWAAVYDLLKKQKATYAKGRVGENVNDYTQWYYGNNTKAAFCFVGISWTLAHAGSSEKVGLDLIGGKKAYVPYIRNIRGYHSGHSGMKVGAIVAVNDFNHIGFCTKISGSKFELFSFNTTHNGSDDAVWNKTYSLSYASGYVNLAYGSGIAEDDDFMAEYVSIDKVTTGDKPSRKEVLEGGKWGQIYFNKANSRDALNHHSADRDFPSFVTGPAYYNGVVSLRVTGLPKGAEGQARIVYVDAKSNAVKAHCSLSEFLGSTGDTFINHACVGYVPEGQKARVEVAVYDIADAKPEVTQGQVRLNVKEI